MKNYTMQQNSRYLIVFSCCLMLSAYFLPVWKIILEAPQYPEGLGMKIWLTGLTGNIDQINGLNHYIGMQYIVEENFWEFKVIPYVFGVIILIGLLSTYLNNRKWLWFWLIILVLFAVAAFVDFYLWEYDYGHNLDPTAAIKVEGMSYQPPLIGYKQLLNFLAGSLPDIGGYLVGAGGLIAAFVLFKEQSLANSKQV